jgi:signal transduction histidine kinase
VVIGTTLFFANRAFQTSIDGELNGVATTAEERLASGTDPARVVEELSNGSQFLELLDARGRMTVRSPNLELDVIPSFLHGEETRSTDGYHTIEFRKTDLRTVRHPLVDGSNNVTGYVVVGNIVPHVDERLLTLTGILIATAAAGIILGTAGTIWFVRREVQPLHDLAQEALGTSASGFERPISDTGAGSEEVRELRHALSTLVESQRQLLDRERHFFADSSHILRTPLAVLQGDIELLEEGIYGRERADVVAQARASIEAMSRTVSGLLLLARDPGDTTPSWEVLDLGPLLAALIADLRVAYPGLTFTCSAEPLEVAGDPAQLRALFLSVLENACRYTPAGGAVDVAAVRAGADAAIEVRDTGVGIPPEELAHLFERFYRGEAARRMFPGGSGLGLAIAARVALLHHGDLTITPGTPAGTSVHITLPLLE